MATTTPDNLWTPDDGDDYALVTDLAAFADTVQAAIKRNGVVSVANTTERATYRPSPASGDRVFRRDVRWEETYLAAADVSLGAAGWYPTSGKLPNIDSSVTAGNSIASGWTSKTGMNQLATGATVNTGGFTFANDGVILPYSGRYIVGGSLQITGNASGSTRGARLVVGSRIYGEAITRSSGFSASAFSFNFGSPFTATSGETLNVQGIQDSGATLSLVLNSFVLTYLGPA